MRTHTFDVDVNIDYSKARRHRRNARLYSAMFAVLVGGAVAHAASDATLSAVGWGVAALPIAAWARLSAGLAARQVIGDWSRPGEALAMLGGFWAVVFGQTCSGQNVDETLRITLQHDEPIDFGGDDERR